MSSSFECSALDCIDGTCAQRCYTHCGGQSSTTQFSCDASGIVCDCVSNGAAVWGSVFGVLCLLLCVVTFLKYWCGRRAASSGERRQIVVIS